MKILSPVFEPNGVIPDKYTCVGEDINPPLTFEDIPEGTKSLVLIVEDPDAPDKTWIHWILYNMSPNISFIAENSKPSNASEGVTDFGTAGYGGPCPPPASPEQLQRGESGSHRYIFRLYALEEMLDEMPEFTDREILTEAMHGHVIEQAELVGTFEKK